MRINSTPQIAVAVILVAAELNKKYGVENSISNGIKDIQLNVTVENISLPSSDTMIVLGIDIDDRLTFDGHMISQTCVLRPVDSLTYFNDWRVPLTRIAVWPYIGVL